MAPDKLDLWPSPLSPTSLNKDVVCTEFMFSLYNLFYICCHINAVFDIFVCDCLFKKNGTKIIIFTVNLHLPRSASQRSCFIIKINHFNKPVLLKNTMDP